MLNELLTLIIIILVIIFLYIGSDEQVEGFENGIYQYYLNGKDELFGADGTEIFKLKGEWNLGEMDLKIVNKRDYNKLIPIKYVNEAPHAGYFVVEESKILPNKGGCIIELKGHDTPITVTDTDDKQFTLFKVGGKEIAKLEGVEDNDKGYIYRLSIDDLGLTKLLPLFYAAIIICKNIENDIKDHSDS